MKVLKDILYKVKLLTVIGSTDVEVSSVNQDSRNVTKGSLFVAVKGVTVDGHKFVDKAIESGATVIVVEQLPAVAADNVVWIQVADSAKALGIIAANFYGNPSSKMKIVAITGTNGKTTTATLLYRLFRKLGYNTGLLSTVQNQINETVIPSTHTTPDAVSIQALLAKMLEAGCTHCFMEASSHAVHQDRIAGLELDGAVFTNITHDHLDYHETFDNYISAKKKLFDDLPVSAFALTNADEKRGMVMVQNTKAHIHTYALKSPADYKGRLIANTLQGLEMEVDGLHTWFKLIGDFNAYNLMAIYGTALLLGEDKMEVLTELSGIETAQGRFEQIISPATRKTAIIDYAHTPDALENVLKTISQFRDGGSQVITVVGCGGDRDRTKRPMMADLACKFSDKVVITSDNPRSEEPQAIIAEMMSGVKITDKRKVLVIADRLEAIRTAVMLAAPGDIILVAGKGHENYQEIKGVKHHFDDKEVVINIFNDEV